MFVIFGLLNIHALYVAIVQLSDTAQSFCKSIEPCDSFDSMQLHTDSLVQYFQLIFFYAPTDAGAVITFGWGLYGQVSFFSLSDINFSFGIKE